jgi:hypothetical protein
MKYLAGRDDLFTEQLRLVDGMTDKKGSPER